MSGRRSRLTCIETQTVRFLRFPPYPCEDFPLEWTMLACVFVIWIPPSKEFKYFRLLADTTDHIQLRGMPCRFPKREGDVYHVQ